VSDINTYTIDGVASDHARARRAPGGVQPPDVTLSRGLGVCMDHAALFEHLARQAGYTVTSMASDTLGHAWNRVQLAGTWWIVDVTWNDGDIFTGGRPIPAAVCRDPDFRRQYFLTTLDEEAARRQAGLINETHDVPDAAPVDYERTLEAIELLDQIQSLTARHNRHVGNTAHLHRQIDGLRRRLDQLARAYPLAVSYSITMR
jgi:hypothetical protein